MVTPESEGDVRRRSNSLQDQNVIPLIQTPESEDCASTDEAHAVDAMLPRLGDEKIHWGIFDENKPLLYDAANAFAEAERYLKAAEFDIPDFPLYIPSVNELRYYGFHINRAFACSDTEEQKEEIRKAIRHCRRASYDALELSMLSHMEVIQRFQEDYRKDVITDVVPDYPAMCEQAESMRDFIGDPSHEQRADYYKDCLPRLETVKMIARKLEYARGSLNAKRSRIRRSHYVVAVSTLAACITALAALNQMGVVSFNSAEDVVTISESPVKTGNKEAKHSE